MQQAVKQSSNLKSTSFTINIELERTLDFSGQLKFYKTSLWYIQHYGGSSNGYKQQSETAQSDRNQAQHRAERGFPEYHHTVETLQLTQDSSIHWLLLGSEQLNKDNNYHKTSSIFLLYIHHTHIISEFPDAVSLYFNELQFLFKCTYCLTASESFTTSWHNNTEMKVLSCICRSEICTSLYNSLLSRRLVKTISIKIHILAVT